MIDRDRLSARVEELEPELDALVADLVAIDSQIPPYADERAVVAHLRQQGEARGLGAGEVMAAAPERPNLVLRVDGNPDGRRLGLCGHVDTKPVGDAAHLWRTDPLVATEIDGMLYGLGTSDMKAAVAAMVIAAQACVEAGITEHGSLELALVADEEAGAQFGSKWLAPQLTHWDGCLIGEPSGWERDWQGLHLVSRGLSCFRITVLGTQRHSSLSDRLPAVNASMQLATLMSRMPSDLVITHPSQQFDDLRPTVNPGVMINGGVYYGVVPGEAMFACDIRAVPGMTLESLTEDLHAWLERAEQELGIEARLEFEPDLTWIDPSVIAADDPLVVAAQDGCARVLADPPPLSFFPGTTDAPWFSAAGVPTIPSLGPGILTYCHGPNEAVSVESVRQAAHLYAHTIVSYLGGA
ncbi:MAG TPA: M20/M25/M40 family metallo-hydrolase [Candidatus Avipropionibacterium avicola]|uniref:M20/M25/M40 family metallo-hydrolase n=1 Tax=Candidatus Avipropionibacterium avicola TaxID=2840701 RepID=A0A9D1H048_9ACTN|nr:M20/M25/M40 family metallo-hydrolase [Candidatus Avipropionibacterium avicola]